MALKIKSKFFSFAKLAGFIAACALASFVVIAPLWLFANKEPRIYTVAVLVAAAAFVVYKCVRAAKKAGAKKSLFFALKALVVLAGIFAAVFALANWMRLLFLAAVVGAAILFNIVSHIEKNVSKSRP